MDFKQLLTTTAEFKHLAADGGEPKAGSSDKPTMPIPYTTNADVAGVQPPSSHPQTEVHKLRKENKELRTFLSMLLSDPYISEYPVSDIKRIVEEKLRGNQG